MAEDPRDRLRPEVLPPRGERPSDALELAHDVPLASKTTLGIGGPARRLVRVTSVDEIRAALHEASVANEPVLVLGEGSNLVVSDAGWPGLVIEMGESVTVILRDGDFARVIASAGTRWDDFVARMVDAGLAGCECLSGIPGLVGATPMQNVGAYGQEVADTITRVQALERQTGKLVDFTPAQCGFAYRSSAFKGSQHWIIIEVEFRFARSETSMPIKYAELARSLGVPAGGTAPLRDVRERVIDLRRAKGMVVDPADPDSRSAGSFFMNPIVGPEIVSAIEATLPTGISMPKYAAPDGKTKLSAAWLIERAGFTKGFARGQAAISHKHALALVNRGGATATELLALAREIQDGVRTRLGVDLHPEPVIL
jgi:UDP-N-acetylmuramate dehydrogenase